MTLLEQRSIILERSVTQLSLLYSLCQSIAGRSEIDDLCRAALDRLPDLVPLEVGAILARRGDHDDWQIRAVKGMPEPPTERRTIPAEHELFAELLSRRKDLLRRDVSCCEIEALGFRQPMQWLWALPVHIDDDAAVCVVVLAGLSPFSPTKEQRWMMLAFTAFFSSVLRSSLAYRELQEKAFAVKQARDYFSSVMSGMSESLVVLNSDRTIRIANQVTADLIGWPADDLIGRPASILFGGDGPLGAGPWEALARGEVVREPQAVLQTRGGGPVPVSFSASAMRGADGEIIGIVCIAHDLREMLRLQDDVLQSRKMGAVGQLAAGVAHEINNPLGVILGFAQGLSERLKEDDPHAGPIRSIVREALRCRDLVQNLLAFSRTSQGEQRQELDLNATIEVALSLVEAQAKVRRVVVRKQLGVALPTVLGNSSQLQQVLINLANNSFDAMAKGGELTVQTRPGAPDRQWVEIHVRDTGAGIPPQIRAQIFEPFFTTKEVGRGTGLGLSMVYEIVKRQGGAIDVRSEEGRGTTFSIRLPAGRAAPEAA